MDIQVINKKIEIVQHAATVAKSVGAFLITAQLSMALGCVIYSSINGHNIMFYVSRSTIALLLAGIVLAISIVVCSSLCLHYADKKLVGILQIDCESTECYDELIIVKHGNGDDAKVCDGQFRKLASNQGKYNDTKKGLYIARSFTIAGAVSGVILMALAESISSGVAGTLPLNYSAQPIACGVLVLLSLVAAIAFIVGAYHSHTCIAENNYCANEHHFCGGEMEYLENDQVNPATSISVCAKQVSDLELHVGRFHSSALAV